MTKIEITIIEYFQKQDREIIPHIKRNFQIKISSIWLKPEAVYREIINDIKEGNL